MWSRKAEDSFTPLMFMVHIKSFGHAFYHIMYCNGSCYTREGPHYKRCTNEGLYIVYVVSDTSECLSYCLSVIKSDRIASSYTDKIIKPHETFQVLIEIASTIYFSIIAQSNERLN